MHASGLIRAARAVAAIVLAILAIPPAAAQLLGPRYPVGLNPAAIALNHVSNKIYVANSDADTVTVVNLNTGATATVAVGDRPFWVAVNPDTNTIFVANRNSSNVTVIDGDTDVVASTPAAGGAGWLSVSPFVDKTFMIRAGTPGEVATIRGTTYELTSATRSQQAVALAVNPVNNRLYVAHATTGDVVAMDMTAAQSFPPLLCPDGAGGFRPQPAPPPAPHNLPCIDIPGTPVAVAVDPANNKVYAVSDGVANRISVINGTNHTHTTLTPAGVSGAARAIAVNAVTGSVYAAFANALVEVVTTTTPNTVNVIATGSGGGGPVGIAIDVNSNVVYVPNADGTMLVHQPGVQTTTVSIPPGARAVAVHPITNTVYVLDASGIQAVNGIAALAPSVFSISISPLPGNTGASTGTIAVNASANMTGGAPLNTIRKVYFRIGTSGAWREAVGTGPYPAHYTGLAPGSYTLQAFATNGLDGPSINTDFATAPVTSNLVSYSFTVGTAAPNPARVTNLSARGMVLTGDDRMIAGFVVNGASMKRIAVVATGPSLAQFGITNPLPNPRLTLMRQNGEVITINDNWQSGANAAPLQAAGLAPPHPLEAGILIDLPSGAYTALLEDAVGGTGVSVLAAYEVEDLEVSLMNLSMRMRVGTGNDVMIGGFVVNGEAPQTVVLVATGPSLSAFFPNPLADPVLTLVRSSDGTAIATNDNWTAATNAAQLLNSGLAPASNLEAAILVTLPPGAYTAIVSGSGGGTGVGILGVYLVK